MICHNCLSHINIGHRKCPYCAYGFENTNPRGTLPVCTVLAGRYTLDKVAAIDGEGVIYKAADAKFKRKVIIKEYLPVTICNQRTQSGYIMPRKDKEVYFKTTRMDFVDLYRALMTVEGTPGLCRVYDLLEINNTAYAVQEIPVGITLERFLEKSGEPLSIQNAISILRPIVYAVEAMHRKGLLHRGISPKTIYVNSSGKAILSGFATIGLRTADSDLKSQIYAGFTAPEQYSASEFDGKYSDVYALAAVFYKAITGVTPPVADRRKQHDTIISPRNVVDNIPTFVSVALMRALRISGAQRMQTAPELLAAITQPNLQRENEKILKNTNQRNNFISIAVIVVCLVIALALAAVLLINSFNKPLDTSTPNTSLSTAVSQPTPEPEYITVPSFVNEEYAKVAQNTEYINNFMFTITEDYSSVFDAGKIMDQTPKEGESVVIGTTIQLIVSRGPQTVLMPSVVGLSRIDAIAALDALGIRYNAVEYVNDGSFAAQQVVRTDYTVGESLDPTKDVVTIYYAAPPPVVSSSVPSLPQSTSTTTP